MLYSVYASTMSEVIPNTKEVHGYVVDHAIKMCFQSGSTTSELEVLR